MCIDKEEEAAVEVALEMVAVETEMEEAIDEGNLINRVIFDLKKGKCLSLFNFSYRSRSRS